MEEIQLSIDPLEAGEHSAVDSKSIILSSDLTDTVSHHTSGGRQRVIFSALVGEPSADRIVIGTEVIGSLHSFIGGGYQLILHPDTIAVRIVNGLSCGRDKQMICIQPSLRFGEIVIFCLMGIHPEGAYPVR